VESEKSVEIVAGTHIILASNYIAIDDQGISLGTSIPESELTVTRMTPSDNGNDSEVQDELSDEEETSLESQAEDMEDWQEELEENVE
jgi:hypothetical protein